MSTLRPRFRTYTYVVPMALLGRLGTDIRDFRVALVRPGESEISGDRLWRVGQVVVAAVNRGDRTSDPRRGAKSRRRAQFRPVLSDNVGGPGQLAKDL
jgi:hypothetical protein